MSSSSGQQRQLRHRVERDEQRLEGGPGAAATCRAPRRRRRPTTTPSAKPMQDPLEADRRRRVPQLAVLGQVDARRPRPCSAAGRTAGRSTPAPTRAATATIRATGRRGHATSSSSRRRRWRRRRRSRRVGAVCSADDLVPVAVVDRLRRRWQLLGRPCAHAVARAVASDGVDLVAQHVPDLLLELGELRRAAQVAGARAARRAPRCRRRSGRAGPTSRPPGRRAGSPPRGCGSRRSPCAGPPPTARAARPAGRRAAARRGRRTARPCSRISGSTASARAIDTRWRMPPDSVAG